MCTSSGAGREEWHRPRIYNARVRGKAGVKAANVRLFSPHLQHAAQPVTGGVAHPRAVVLQKLFADTELIPNFHCLPAKFP